MNHIADNQDALLDYLYEEGDPAERLMVAKHLQECAVCSVAVLEFQNVRGMLNDWTPPASHVGFRIVQDRGQSPGASATSPSATVVQGARGGKSWGWGPTTTHESWRGWRPALQAAAAVLLFVSGMAVSQLHVDYQDGGVMVHWRSAEPAMPAAEPPTTAANIRNIVLPAERASSGAAPNTPIDIIQIERELRDRLASTNTPPVDTERLLQRVRAMIDQSEQRQQQQLALRLSQVAREVDTQHQADLLRIQNDFGQQQEATMNYLVRTSGGAK